MHSAKHRQDGGLEGVLHNLVEFGENIPAIFGRTGELARPLLRRGAVSPNNVLKQYKGGRARHGLQTPCRGVKIEFGAGWGTWERLPLAHFYYTPRWPKRREVYIPPCDHFPYENDPYVEFLGQNQETHNKNEYV